MRFKTRNLSLSLILALIAATLIPSASYAAKAVCDPTSCTDEIDRIYVLRSGSEPLVYVSIEDRTLAGQKLSCKLVSGYYFTLSGDHPAFNQIFSLLLDAKNRTTDSKRNRVTIRIVDNSPNCEILYVVAEWPNNP
jgi:hypothetical protein